MDDIRKDVIISVTGSQKDAEGDVQPVAFVTQGRFYKKGGRYYISYDESSITGMEGTRTTICRDADGLSVLRTGKNPSRLQFRKDEKYMALYSTEYGDLTLVVDTRNVSDTLTDEGGTVSVDYSIRIENGLASANSLNINVKQKEQRRTV